MTLVDIESQHPTNEHLLQDRSTNRHPDNNRRIASAHNHNPTDYWSRLEFYLVYIYHCRTLSLPVCQGASVGSLLNQFPGWSHIDRHPWFTISIHSSATRDQTYCSSTVFTGTFSVYRIVVSVFSYICHWLSLLNLVIKYSPHQLVPYGVFFFAFYTNIWVMCSLFCFLYHSFL